MLTVLVIAYNANDVLLKHYEEWKNITGNIKFIVIDDCSTIPVVLPEDSRVTGYRILDDIPWNNAGANNLGFLVAKTEWVFRLDVDHLVTKETMENLPLFEKGKLYHPTRLSPNGNLKPGHCNIYVMNREDYWSCGGYDEDFCGNYAQEDHYFLHYSTTNIIKVGMDCKVKMLTKAETKELNRDKMINKKLLDNKLSSRIPQSKDCIRFSWKKI